ncbi:MAG: BrnT family toxin [Clostridiales bacterium]|nr:BrnT family toxin [Clostridiales bacterium]
MNSDFNVYIVCHCYRMDNDIIRIISARRANIKEVDVYVRQL